MCSADFCCFLSRAQLYTIYYILYTVHSSARVSMRVRVQRVSLCVAKVSVICPREYTFLTSDSFYFSLFHLFFFFFLVVTWQILILNLNLIDSLLFS